MDKASVTRFYDGPVVDRRIAAQDGSKYYFTGKPCGKGHIALRYTSGFSCVVCSSLRAAIWGKDNPEAAILKARRYRERHPDRRDAAVKKWRDSNPEKVRKSSKEWWGANPERKAEYYARQRVMFLERRERHLGKKPAACECCGDEEVASDKRSRIVFDHCHASRKPRGWICHNCNIALGHAKDSVGRLQKMIDYLSARSKS